MQSTRHKVAGWVYWACAFTISIALIGWIFALTERIHDLDSRFTVFQGQLVGKTPEGFHRADMQDWCNAFSRLNPAVKCPNPYETPAFKAKWR